MLLAQLHNKTKLGESNAIIACFRVKDMGERSHIQSVSGSSTADELSKLADLRDRGVITDAEFEAQKAKLLS